LSQKNALWREDRNYLAQALSNFSAALTVPNRSSCLLYYYAMLNFAKSELMPSHHGKLVNKRIQHGLSFNLTNARSVSGDFLTVQDGIFPMLYEARTGFTLPKGTRLPIQRLLRAIPEIGQQCQETGVAPGGRRVGMLQMVAFDQSRSWILLALEQNDELRSNNATGRWFRSKFREVDAPEQWRDNFGLSRRWTFPLVYWESIDVADRASEGAWRSGDALALSWALHPFIETSTSEEWDAFLAPSLYKSRLLPMPPSLARYAVMFYASSLVRYKPSMFDAAAHPELAFLFDAIARECALPMAIDVHRALSEVPVTFRAAGSLRL